MSVQVANSINDVVLMVINQAKQVNKKFTIRTSLRKQAANMVLDKLNQLDNFYTSVHTSYVMYGEVITSMEFTFTYIDAFAIVQVCRRQASESKLTAKQKQVYSKAKAIVAQYIKKDMSDYQKELVLNAYLIKTCVYDKDAYNCPNQSDPRYIDAYTPYGVLFKGRAVCDGYAQTASILFTLSGMENYILRSETHAWNLVRVGGNFYHLDITWNGTTNTKEFFNLTDEQISKYDKHNWRNKGFYPRATATQFHYFVYNNLVVRNMTEMKQRIKKDLDAKKRVTNMWLAGFTLTGSDITKVITELNNLGYKIGSFSYKLPNLNPLEYSTTLSITF